MPNFRTQRILRHVTKTLFGLFILAVNAILLWRVLFSTAVPASIKTVNANDRLIAAYEEYGSELTLRYQKPQMSVTTAEKNYGYFSVQQCLFIPEAEQVQVIVRYNKSTFQNVAKDYGLSEVPDRTDRIFDVTLIKTTDLTPDNEEDNAKPEFLSEERYFPTGEAAQDTTALYTYYRYVFDGVTLDDLTVGVFVDFYYTGDCDYEKDAYGTLCGYFKDFEWIDYKLTRADKAALTAAK